MSIFDGRSEYDMACPVLNCWYQFPHDLEDAAIERHCDAHDENEWGGVRRRLRLRRTELVARTDMELNVIDADLQRLARWTGKD